MKVGQDAQGDLCLRIVIAVLGLVAAASVASPEPTIKRPASRPKKRSMTRPADDADSTAPKPSPAPTPGVTAGTGRGATVYQVSARSWSRDVSVPESLDLLDIADRVRGFLGMFAILGVAVFLSENRRAISRRVVLWGLALQWGFAVLVLRVPAGVQTPRAEPARASNRSWTAPWREPDSSSASALVDPDGPVGFVFAFRVLPTVIFVAALFAVLYHLGVMQWVVRGFAVVMAWLMGTSGAESLERRGLAVSGADRGSAHDPPVSAQADPVGALDRDDLGNGPCFRRRHGRVHRVTASRPGIS